MEEPPSPYMQPPPSPGPNSNLTVLYYGVFIAGAAAIVLVLYNFIIIKWCTDNSHSRPRQRIISGCGTTSTPRFGDPRINSTTSFKYKKHGLAQDKDKDQGNDYECAVCLSEFEEGEEVRMLLRCKHSFHAPCIDMWLYSHSECPLCRSPVGRPVPHRNFTVSPSENSHEGLLHASRV